MAPVMTKKVKGKAPACDNYPNRRLTAGWLRFQRNIWNRSSKIQGSNEEGRSIERAVRMWDRITKRRMREDTPFGSEKSRYAATRQDTGSLTHSQRLAPTWTPTRLGCHCRLELGFKLELELELGRTSAFDLRLNSPLHAPWFSPSLLLSPVPRSGPCHCICPRDLASTPGAAPAF
ncbi:unnamed protein product [Rhizoctonia solani]|uniref:Uncharacterized protein n=1 Tax=Rhizoctonia solani TaxID=456999 RepID=A0A8H3BR17_9AGAM|nr:unnamed protein product [Rhizoctonia solani]